MTATPSDVRREIGAALDERDIPRRDGPYALIATHHWLQAKRNEAACRIEGLTAELEAAKHEHQVWSDSIKALRDETEKYQKNARAEVRTRLKSGRPR